MAGFDVPVEALSRKSALSISSRTIWMFWGDAAAESSVTPGGTETLRGTMTGTELRSMICVRSAVTVKEEELRRFTEALNLYLINLTSDEITMPIIIRIESIMGSVGAMVHQTIKIIYETMSELDTAEIKLEGVTKLLNYPEYSDVSRVRELLGMLEEKDKLLDVISAQSSTEDDLHVYIGDDSGEIMSDTSMIFKTIHIGGKQLSVGVIGPKRMNYEKVIGMINQLATGLDRMFGDDRMLGDGKSKF